MDWNLVLTQPTYLLYYDTRYNSLFSCSEYSIFLSIKISGTFKALQTFYCLYLLADKGSIKQ